METWLAIVPPAGSAVDVDPSLVLAVVAGLVLVSVWASAYAARLHAEFTLVASALAKPPEVHSWTTPSTGPKAWSDRKSTALLLVQGYDTLGTYALVEISRRFPGAFSQVAFVAATAFDMTDPEREAEGRRRKAFLERELRRYLPIADLMGMEGVVHAIVGSDPVQGSIQACERISRFFPKVVLFWPRPEISPSSWHHGWLPAQGLRKAAQILFRRGWVTMELPVPVTVRMPSSRQLLRTGIHRGVSH